MNKVQEKYRGWMMAITFAEAGEWETAREMIPASGQGKIMDLLRKSFMAVAFAEENLHQEALRILEGWPRHLRGMGDFLDSIGLRGVPVTYAVLSAEAV